jgi:hypothetical protein
MLTAAETGKLYQLFQSPITTFDCGDKCAPYNESGVPFCCDTRHAVPTAYDVEWEYLVANTDLWHEWQSDDPLETNRMLSEKPEGQVLIECLGHKACQRQFRSITCRAFPFFPYIDQNGRFIGMTYYWEYEDRCWVVSHLDTVTSNYLEEFVRAFERLFELRPQEKENFRYHSIVMRRIFGRRHRSIFLLHRNGKYYKITPRNGRLRRVATAHLPAFGPYRIATQLPFPGEE